MSTLVLTFGAWALVAPAPAGSAGTSPAATAYPAIGHPDDEVHFDRPRPQRVPGPAGLGDEPSEDAAAAHGSTGARDPNASGAPQAPVRTIGGLFELMDRAARDGRTVVLAVE